MSKTTRALIGYGGFAVVILAILVTMVSIAAGSIFTGLLMVLSAFGAAVVLAWVVIAITNWVEDFND